MYTDVLMHYIVGDIPRGILIIDNDKLKTLWSSHCESGKERQIQNNAERQIRYFRSNRYSKRVRRTGN